MFVDEPGTPSVKWLTSATTKVLNGLIFVVNEQVCTEFERKIRHFSNSGKLSAKKADEIFKKFTRHYKGKEFRVIGQKIISNTKQETTIEEVIRDLNLNKGKGDWDGLIYQSIINALAYLAGESHPILVTCDEKFGKKVKTKGYRVIDPEKQNPNEIRKIFAQNPADRN